MRGQYAYEKMLKTNSYKGNTNYCIYIHIIHIIHILLMGMKNGTITLEEFSSFLLS